MVKYAETDCRWNDSPSMSSMVTMGKPVDSTGFQGSTASNAAWSTMYRAMGTCHRRR